MSVTKTIGSTKPVVIQNFVIGRPPFRTQFSIADWRGALDFAELMYNPVRVRLYDIYADVLLDPQVSKQWSKRVDNITNVKWRFSKDGEENEEMTTLCKSPAFTDLLTEAIEHIGYGISVIELGTKIVSQFGKQDTLLSMYSVDRKNIRPDKGTIVKEQYDTGDEQNAIHYREGTNPLYVAEIGKPKDLGIFLQVAPYVILKKGAVSDWALFVQLFGQPFREYKYDGYDDAVRIKLEKAAQDMGSAPYIIMPEGGNLVLHEIKNNNTGQVHQGLVDYCDKMISIYILGNTLTTDNTKVGSNALGQVHAETEADTFASDMQKITNILNHTIRPILYNLGYPVAAGEFHPQEEKDIQAVQDRLKIYQTVKSLGVPISDDDVYEESGVPKPADYEKQKSDLAAQADAGGGPGPGKPGKPGGKKPAKKADLKESKWLQLRATLADFFDPAR